MKASVIHDEILVDTIPPSLVTRWQRRTEPVLEEKSCHDSHANMPMPGSDESDFSILNEAVPLGENEWPVLGCLCRAGGEDEEGDGDEWDDGEEWEPDPYDYRLVWWERGYHVCQRPAQC